MIAPQHRHGKEQFMKTGTIRKDFLPGGALKEVNGLDIDEDFEEDDLDDDDFEAAAPDETEEEDENEIPDIEVLNNFIVP